MEAKQILHQRFQYADIIPYMDYSKLSKKPKNLGMNTFDVDNVVEEQDEDELFGGKIKWSKPIDRNNTLPLYTKDELPKNKKNTRFFYSDSECGLRIPLTNYVKKKKRFITTKDRHIKNHYGRPFSSIAILTYERTIYQKGDTVTVKTNTYTKSRYFNCKFFKTNWSTEGFSINLKTGNFVTFSKDKINQKNARIRKNVFPFLLDVLNTHILDFNNKINTLTDYASDQQTTDLISVRGEFKEKLNDFEFIQSLHSYLSTIPGFTPEEIPYSALTHKNTTDWLMVNMINLFIKIKGIKVPNNFHQLLIGWYPTQKFLKKNDNKLIAAILDRIGLKSKKTIRIIHENPEMDIVRLYNLVKYFGKEDFNKYLGNLNMDYFKGTPQKITYGSQKKWLEPIENIQILQFSDGEKSNILKLLNELTENRKDDGVKFESDISNQLRSIDDHYNMLINIKEYFPDVAFRATNWKSFHEEHMMLSRLQGLIRRGYTTEFIFEEDMVNHVETPILTADNTFYPVLLKKDVEYTEEGNHMHHCVGSYSDRESSIIVSLRLGSDCSSDRITCEFSTTTKKVVQAKSFCNAVPPYVFHEALNILYERIGRYPKSIKSIDKIKTPIIEKSSISKALTEPANIVNEFFTDPINQF